MYSSSLRAKSAPHDARAQGHALLPVCALIALCWPLSSSAQEQHTDEHHHHAHEAAAPAQAPAATTLPTTTVRASATANQPLSTSTLEQDAIASQRARSSDTASLLRSLPGVSLQPAGGVSSLPSVHGLKDERLRIQLDGMDLHASCGNHMNPPLSYIDPTRVGTVRLFAGITPVSVGGDSIGATIQVESLPPAFAAPGTGTLLEGEVGAWGRSNGHAKGGHASATYATEQFSLRYDGSVAQSGNYRAARSFKDAGPASSDQPQHWLRGDEVGSSSYLTRNHSLNLAWRGAQDLVELRLGAQDIPYQNFANQRMDMTGNSSQQFNLRYQGQRSWGKLQARAYHERTRHSMNFGEDKQFWYGPAGDVPGMPMDTRGRTSGAEVRAQLPLSARDTLEVGALAQRYTLDDWWNPSGGGMAPNVFWNIRDGQRERFDLFAEWQARWNPQWFTQVGVRSSHIRMNSGQVQGYNANYDAEAQAFNALERKRSDQAWDFSALARYSPSAHADYEFGFARKSRAPSLYERYAWSTGGMAMRMVNWVGDGNGYVGNPNLRPETAHTLSASAHWHDASGEQWRLSVTPYVSHVNNYIGAQRCSGGMGMMSSCTAANASAQQGFVYLRLHNQDVRLHGLDISGMAQLADSPRWGRWALEGSLSYVSGKDRDTGEHLYALMPLNARLAVTHRQGGWSNSAELLAVRAKTKVSAIHNERPTAGYALVNLRTSYQWQQWQVELGVDNLFNRFYRHPQGGAYTGQGNTMSGTGVPWGVALPGMGRSVYVGVNYKF